MFTPSMVHDHKINRDLSVITIWQLPDYVIRNLLIPHMENNALTSTEIPLNHKSSFPH